MITDKIAHLLFSLFISLISFSVAAQNNCQPVWQHEKPPQHIIALNQHAADIIIALDAGDKIQGVSFIDDSFIALKTKQYHGIPVFSARYPATEKLIASKTDFVVAGFSSAFQSSMGSQSELARADIGSYLLSAACNKNAESGFESVKNDLRILGQLLDKTSQAELSVSQIEADLKNVDNLALLAQKPTVFYLDSQSDTLMTQGSLGFINEMIERAGGENIFASMPLRSINVSAESVLIAQPDYIILADAVWSPADKKIKWLESHPALAHLHAVKQKHYIILPFSALYPNVKSSQALLTLAYAIRNH